MFCDSRPLLRLLSLAATCAVVGASPAFPSGGNRFRTTHALVDPLDDASHTHAAFPDTQIKEWHFHTYFFQQREDSVAAALRLQARLIRAVARGDVVIVCDGVTDEILPGLNESEVPQMNMKPVGPHPAGSFETWVPAEHLAFTLSLFMLYREELSILVHPLTLHTIEDHTGRTMWLGDPWPIDRTVLSPTGGDPPQYRSLGLGYSGSAAMKTQRRRMANEDLPQAALDRKQHQRIDIHTFLANQRSDNVKVHSLLSDLDRRSNRIPERQRNATMDL